MADHVSRIRLGLSKEILPYAPTEVLEAEYKFHKLLVRSVQNTVAGLAVGAVASLFFKRNYIIYYSAGFGLGYTIFSTFGTGTQSSISQSMYLKYSIKYLSSFLRANNNCDTASTSVPITTPTLSFLSS